MDGYQGIGIRRNEWVPMDEALNYALQKTGLSISDPAAPEHTECIRAFLDWYYSGNFYQTYKEET